MAFIQNQSNLLNDQTDQTNQSQDNNDPIQTANGTGDNSSVSPGSPQGVTAAPTSSKAPPVQDLHAYLAANAPQAVQFGQKIANNLNTTAGKVTGDINAAQQDLSGQVAAQNIAPNQQLIESAANDPAQFVQDPSNLAAFAAQRDASYGGPESFESTPYSQNLTNEVTNAKQQAPDINKPGGVIQLARGQEKNPTTGMSNLDALLLEQNAQALNPVRGAISKFGDLGNQLDTARTSTNASIQDAIKNDQAAKAGVQSRFLTGDNAVVPAWQKNLGTEVTNAQGQADTYNKSVDDVIAKENALKSILSPTEQSISDYNNQNYNPIQQNVSPNSKLPAINYDLSQFSKAPDKLGAATLPAVASQKDYDTEAALNKLLGTNLSDLNPADAGKAGSFKVPANASLPVQEAIKSLGDELAAAKSGYTNNGALQYSGTPADSIVNGNTLAPGTKVYYPSLGGGQEQPIINPTGPLPKGWVEGFVPNEGAQINPNNGGHTTYNPFKTPGYYTNTQLQGAGKNISDLITYLQGIK